MAKDAAARERDAAQMRRLREHYRRHLVQPRAGRPYNPLLDDPDHPDNIRHWAHGTVEGYKFAGCKCEPDTRRMPEPQLTCTEANTRYEQKGRLRALDRFLTNTQEPRIRGLLHQVLPTLSGEDLDRGTQLVRQAHHVVSLRTQKVRYDSSALELALRAWRAEASVDFDDDTLHQLTTDLHGLLNEG